MTLARQMALLIVGVLLLAIGGSLTLHQLGARDALRQQQGLRNSDAATLLALTLSQQQGDEAAMTASVSAWFELGTFEHIALTAADGRVVVERRAPARASTLPPWLLRLSLPDAPAARARVAQGERDWGIVSVHTHGSWVQDALWHSFVRTGGLLALLGAGAAALAAWLLAVWQRPLQRTIEQARAVEEGRFTQVEEPRAPELRRVTRSMNSMVRRLSDMFDAQATQLTELQRRAHLDGVTGLANRRHFVGRFEAALHEPSAQGHGLLIVRVLDLPGLNERHGHDRVDQLLAALAQVLEAYPQRVADALTGRLNGSDLALSLPVSGITQETGESLLVALRAAAASALGLATSSSDAVGFVIGAADALRSGTAASAALAAADVALAQAEEHGMFSLRVEGAPAALTSAGGARAWRGLISRALDERRVRLDEAAVHDGVGRLLFLSCPLQIQIDPTGPYQTARRWLGMASRSRLMTRLDLAAIELALRACASDHLPRSVRLAAASLATRGFAEELGSLLARHSAAAPMLRVEIDERSLAIAADVLPLVWAVLRPHGVQLGIEHAGSALHGDVLTRGVVLSHVTLRSHLVHGVASDPAVQDLARGLVAFVHGLGALIVAEGVASNADLAMLWTLGFDGVTAAPVAASIDQSMSPV